VNLLDEKFKISFSEKNKWGGKLTWGKEGVKGDGKGGNVGIAQRKVFLDNSKEKK